MSQPFEQIKQFFRLIIIIIIIFVLLLVKLHNIYIYIYIHICSYRKASQPVQCAPTPNRLHDSIQEYMCVYIYIYIYMFSCFLVSEYQKFRGARKVHCM